MIFECKMCGGTLEINENQTIATCGHCGRQQTLPRLDDDRRVQMYDRANHFRRNNEFDKAMRFYEKILDEDNTDAEAYWSLVLCNYGIEYVEDSATHNRVPTVNRAQFTSIFDDDNYKSALQYADGYQKSIYEEEAKTINEIQKGILAISQKKEPFDIFICYKETDNNGRRTQDSVLANDIYHQLTNEGFKVFFSRITLEDKLGTAYEPYIFAALSSAKVMVVIGTKPEFFNAVWVKNEWSRYLSLVKQSGGRKVLIPVYRDMDPYDLPEEFSHLQAQDMSKLGFMQDLIRGIKKLTETTAPQTIIKENAIINGNAEASPLLKRAFIYLEDRDWENADTYCERVLDLEPENGQAYLGKFLSNNHISRKQDISKTPKKFDTNDLNFKKALSFLTEKDKVDVLKCISDAKDEYEKLNSQIEHYHDKTEIPQNKETAFELYKLAAENENPLAYIMLAKCYERGLGCQKNLQFAYKNYLRSVKLDGGHIATALLAEGLYEVGRCLLFGIGVQRSYQDANKYLAQSAAMGYPYAEYQLGFNYCSGLGFNADVKKGIAHLNKACERNVSAAHKALGDISLFGYFGYQKDLDYAINKYTEAINCEDDIPSQAYLHLSRCYQQKKDYSMALNILMQGNEKNHSDCQNEIGLFYEFGLGIPVDKSQALEWYNKASNNGSGQALYKLGCLYEAGDGVEQNANKAYELFRKSAQAGVPMANYKMGIYAENSGNYNNAKDYYEKAAKKNIASAYNNLGALYQNGRIGKRSKDDMKMALSYYVHAAKMGMDMAQNNAGCMYYDNYELDAAHYWFEKAANQGYKPAIQNLQMILKKERQNRTLSYLDKFSKL